MTTAKLRAAGLIAVVISLVATLTACGSGPGQINTAAIVDGTRISVDEVQALVEKVVAEQPAALPLAQQHKLDLVAREAVSQLVVHELITRVAREEGITVDPTDVADAMARDPFGQALPEDGSVPADALATQLVYRARDQRETVTDQILLAQLANRYYDKLQITMDYTTVTSADPTAETSGMRDQAEAKAREFAADPDRVGELISSDVAEGVDANEGAEFAALQDPTLAASVMFGSAEGSVVAFQPAPGQALWVIGLIRSRETSGSPEVAEPAQVSAEQLVTVGERLLQPYVEETEIRISPRYGVWDLAGMSVAPSAAETVGLVIPPGRTSR